MGSASENTLEVPYSPSHSLPSLHGLLWPPPCLFLKALRFCTQHPEDLKTANQLITLVMSKILPMASKPLLASSLAPLPRPTDFFSLLEWADPILPQNLAPCFPPPTLWSQLRPFLKQLFLTPVSPPHPLRQRDQLTYVP